ncbi:MAG TPA: substrate-binding and VWA domain-containing protein [Actinophytocola sp.]|uniref:substrate-binding and VWA domain-containing protein n=1 Tax=Actinophytocola sp. TaxID=1872138 RepID=UPI002DBC8725|nr:substrate-binding and VWA domain-containing protein [Actinophytocola sp.]HEU5475398.1 substrate-binding and VWA domain-containing protein [Actinophytocola sp.]
MLLLSVLLVVLLIGWFTFDFLRDRLQASGCDVVTTLNVTAAPDIAPTVTQAGRKAAEAGNPGCYKVNVSQRDSAVTAESLAVSDGTEPPDVWIPESTMWLQRAQDKGAWNSPIEGTSIASSPVVIGLTEEKATELGWPNEKIGWATLLGPNSPVTLGMPDPAKDPVGISTLFGLRDVVKNAADPAAAGTAAMRKLAPNTLAANSELLARLPGGTSQAAPLDGFPISENALLRHNVRQEGGLLVAAYADSPVPSLDYPYVVLPEASEAKREVAQKFLELLQNQETADALADAGFRTPDGKSLRERTQDQRTSSEPLNRVPVPDPADGLAVLNTWAAVNLSGRVQVLIDVSGSMAEPVPGTGKTRMDLTMQAAVQGTGLFKPTTKIGWWTFSTKLDGDRDYTVLLPMRTVAEHLAAGAIDTLKSVQAKEGGGTGLYDSVLAAMQDARANWEPGRINVVTVLTDGKNDDKDSITLEQLLVELKKLQDPKRPLLLTAIGIGDGVSQAELKAIAEPTGGAAFVTPDPTKINEIFYASLSKMLCQPPTCKAGNGR